MTPQRIFKIVFVFWLIGWYSKISFFKEYLWGITIERPLHYSFFPEIFTNPLTAQAAYVMPVLALVLVFLKTPLRYCWIAGVWIVSSLLMLGHLNTYNDATFVTSFWTAGWLFGLAWNLNPKDETVREQAQFSARCIVGMIFLGGLAGKLTPEYWNGDVFYHTHILQGQAGIWLWLRQHSTPEQMLIIARYFSQIAMAAEAFLVLSPVLPSRFVLTAAPAVMSGIVLFNTWRIFSVFACLIGILLACLIWELSAKRTGT